MFEKIKYMKSNKQEKINFSIPIEISKGIVNADADVLDKNITDYDVDNMYLEGLASTPKIDLDNQVLKPSGFLLDYFTKSAFINWNHQNYPDCIIGEPVDVKVTGEKFFLKSKLYPWSNMAKSVYEIALNLEKDKTSDRSLGYSVEGITLDVDKNNIVNKLLVTGCAICFTPKNNDSYARVVKGITLEEARELRKSFIFKPVFTEVEKGVKTDYIYKLDVGEKTVLIDSNFNFHYKDNPIFNVSSMEEVRKAICTLAQGYKEGFIKENKKDELIKQIQEKAKFLKK